MLGQELPVLHRVSCDGCGACCLHLGIPPFDSYDDDDIEFALLPQELKDELTAAWDVYFAQEAARYETKIPNATGTPCCWLDLETRRCRQYEYRPDICSRFEPGCEICLEDRMLAGIDQPRADLPGH